MVTREGTGVVLLSVKLTVSSSAGRTREDETERVEAGRRRPQRISFEGKGEDEEDVEERKEKRTEWCSCFRAGGEMSKWSGRTGRKLMRLKTTCSASTG